MNRFDTVKVLLKSGSFRSVNLKDPRAETRHMSKIDKHGEEVRSHNTSIKNAGYGFNGLDYNHIKDEVSLRLSAKIFKDEEYFQGIHKNNFDRVIHEVNESGLIEINPNKAYDCGLYLGIDVTDNLDVSSLNTSVNSIIQAGALSPYYNIKRHKTGYEATRKAKKNNHRQIGYQKTAEFSQKAMREYLKKYPKAEQGYKDNTLRIESNLRTLKQIRDNFHTVDTRLKRVMEAPNKVNLDVFNRIIAKGEQSVLFEFVKKAKGVGHFIDLIGWNTLFEEHNNNPEHVIEFIKNAFPRTSKSNGHSYWSEKVRQWYIELDLIPTETVSKSINEIKSLLSIAS